MKKIIVLAITTLIICVGFLCGCNEQKTETEQELKINFFTVTPNYIELGDTANISWETTGASTVSIDQGFGDVGLQGTLIISPIGDRVYHLYASNGIENISAVVSIVVSGGTDIDYTSPETPTLAWSVDTANDQITIVSCFPTDIVYSSSATVANLVFKSYGNTYYPHASGFADPTQTMLDTGTIDAGDVIRFNATGTYTVVWIPSNEVLGSFSI